MKIVIDLCNRCGHICRIAGGIARDKNHKKMKTEMISAKSAKQARKLAPWAAVVTKVDGGYMAYASVTDYQTWRRQK